MKPVILSYKIRSFERLALNKASSGKPSIVSDGRGNLWRLSVYPGGSKGEDKGIHVSLKRSNPIPINAEGLTPRPVKAKVTIIVRDSAGNSFMDDDYDAIDDFREEVGGLIYETAITRSEIIDKANNILLADGSLAIDVELQLVDQSEAFLPSNPAPKNMLKFLESGNDSDVTFNVQDTTVAAHKLVLKMNAPFLASFVCEQHQDGSPIEIKDSSPEAFRFALKYIYGDEIPKPDELRERGKELIEVANRFELVELKLAVEHACVELRVASVENVVDWLLFADAKTCPHLKEYAKSYFTVRSKDVMAHESYKKLRETPDLKDELMEAMAKAPKSYFVDVGRMSVCELRAKLAEMDLDVDGSKEMLVNRLKEAQSEEAQSEDGEGEE
ncbi:hypothetical protein ACHAXT_001452 [Thalassiosira profunda]